MGTTKALRRQLIRRGFTQEPWSRWLVSSWSKPTVLTLAVSLAMGVVGGWVLQPQETTAGQDAGIRIAVGQLSISTEGRGLLVSVGDTAGEGWWLPWNKDFFQFALAFSALALALLRWTASREERAMDSYLDHRRAVNNMIWESARAVAERHKSGTPSTDLSAAVGKKLHAADESQVSDLPKDLQHDHEDVLRMTGKAWTKGGGGNALRDLFVYSELDILEMAFIKYRKGMMTPEAAKRMSDVMLSRCGDCTFRHAAIELTTKGMYVRGFTKAVERISEEAIAAGPQEKAVTSADPHGAPD